MLGWFTPYVVALHATGKLKPVCLLRKAMYDVFPTVGTWHWQLNWKLGVMGL